MAGFEHLTSERRVTSSPQAWCAGAVHETPAPARLPSRMPAPRARTASEGPRLQQFASKGSEVRAPRGTAARGRTGAPVPYRLCTAFESVGVVAAAVTGWATSGWSASGPAQRPWLRKTSYLLHNEGRAGRGAAVGAGGVCVASRYASRGTCVCKQPSARVDTRELAMPDATSCLRAGGAER